MNDLAESKPLERFAAERLIALSPAWLSLAAAAIHFAVLGSHYEESWMYGTFFAVVAWAQAAWALLVVQRPARWLYWAGAAGNAAIIVMWAITRTAGVPLGPASGEIEDVAFIDLLATVVQALIVVACITALTGRWWTERQLMRVALVAIAVVLALAVVPLTSAALVDETRGAMAEHGEPGAETAAAGLGSAAIGDLEVSGAFARPAAAGGTGVAYFTVRNRGAADDALIEASTDAATSAGLEETVMQGASESMRPMSRIEVPAGGDAVLEPGGYHVMLADLKQELRGGDSITLRVRFERAGSVPVTVPVLPYTEETPEEPTSDHSSH